MALLEGVKLNLGGREFIVPALNFRALRTLESHIKKIEQLSVPPTGAEISSVVTVVHAALFLNYPGITMEEVENLLDLRNVVPVLKAIMGASGLDEPDAGKEAAAAAANP